MSDDTVQQLNCLLKVPIERVEFNPKNVRETTGDLEELAESIRELGILQPLVVVPHPRSRRNFLLVAGHRRLEAAHMAGLTHVQVIVRVDLASPDEVTAAMLVENLHRLELTKLEQAKALRALIDSTGLNQQQVAKRIGKSQPWVSQRLALLELTPEERRKLEAGEIAERDAYNQVRAARGAAGTTRTYDASGQPFDHTHPLAARVKDHCAELQHHTRRLLGRQGCPECWEHEIRADERRRLVEESRTA